MAKTLTLDHLRDHAVARTLFKPTTLPRAIARLGFVQADPLRAPARAQDLILRHRVAGYRAGELDARYPRLAVEEDFLVNYGYLPRHVSALMHPRPAGRHWTPQRERQARAVLQFVQQRGAAVHPAEVDAAFQHGTQTNGFGGTGRVSTQLLDAMHHRGWLRVARREGGVRLYAPRTPAAAPPAAARSDADADAVWDALTDLLVALYAPISDRSLNDLLRLLRGGLPQWADRHRAALARAVARLPQAVVEGQRWLWPAGENPASARHARAAQQPRVLLLAPFDPIVWDRRRFEALWGWAYRFEAYVPAAQRQRGHYALPLLWRGHAVGWANLRVQAGRLQAEPGYAAGRAPQDAGYAAALEDELQRMAGFLGLG